MENVFCIVDKSFKFLTLSVSQYTVWDYPGLDGEQSIMVCVACKGIKHTKFWFVRWNQKKILQEHGKNLKISFNTSTLMLTRPGSRIEKWTRVKKILGYKNEFLAHIYMCKLSKVILPQVHLRKPCYDFSFL